MSNVNLENLPPEMQARIAQIISGAKQQQIDPQYAVQPVVQHNIQTAPSAPVVKQPSLMDHTIALRQEVADLRQQITAVGQVTEAVGNAVGQLYAMFQQQTQPTNFSTGFQEGPVNEDDY